MTHPVVENSYMLPHGTRWAAMPRQITPAMSRTSPSAVRDSPMRPKRSLRSTSSSELCAGGAAGGGSSVRIALDPLAKAFVATSGRARTATGGAVSCLAIAHSAMCAMSARVKMIVAE